MLVLEAVDHIGGALGHAETTLPGFRHDVGAGFVAFRDSAAFQALDLGRHGLRWALGELESAHPAPDGTCPAIGRDRVASSATFGEDAAAWEQLVRDHAPVDQALLGFLGTLPPIGPALQLVRPAGLRLAAMALSSPGGFSRRTFATEAARRVLPGMGMHVDVGPEDRVGAAIGYMLSLRAAMNGFAVPVGGAGAVPAALAAELAAHGGRIQLDSRVVRILVSDRRAVGVVLADGTEIRARGVLADVSAPAMYLDLLGEAHIPGWAARFFRRYPMGWGTFKLDFALSEAVPWSAEPARRAAVVHAGDDLLDLTRFVDQVRRGELPDHPYLVVGQQSLVDPSRAPEGQHTLYVYTRVPARPDRPWSELRESYADCIERRIEELAPGFRSRIRGRAIQTPDDLFAMDANLVDGDLGGGSNQWWRQAFFRPLFPWFRYRTPVAGAWLGSMYTHPGTGIHGMCGWNAAGVALRDL